MGVCTAIATCTKNNPKAFQPSQCTFSVENLHKTNTTFLHTNCNAFPVINQKKTKLATQENG